MIRGIIKSTSTITGTITSRITSNIICNEIEGGGYCTRVKQKS